MSGSSSLSSDPLSEAERVDVRRFCGYPAFGAGSSGFQSWRFFDSYGLLEFRMTNMSADELRVTRQYLASLYALEQAIPTSAANLDTEKAAVWTHNSQEVVERTRLYEQWQRRLTSFIGVPPGPALAGGCAIVI